jgi:membrane protein YqaA with SNARE-associated domain
MNDEPIRSSRREVAFLALRGLGGLAALLALMVVLAHTFRAPLERLARAFAESFGYAGLALGTFVADGFHFPIPPQFYMLLAVSSEMSQPLAFGAITIASLAGGFAGYSFAGRLAGIRIVARRLARSRELAQRAFSRFGVRGTIVAGLLPVPYSVLCYLAGLQGLPANLFLLFTLLRIPRLLVYYYLVRLGWSA